MCRGGMSNDELIRQSVALIKRKFLQWRIPPVELPAESVIEECVRLIIEAAQKAEREDVDGDIYYADGTPVVIEGFDETIKRVEFIVASSGAAMFTIYDDGTYSINPNLTAEQYKQALGMVIEYFTKGK